MRLTADRLKTVATLALVASLTLPAYTCPGYVAPDGKLVTEIPKGGDSSQYRPTEIPHYPLQGKLDVTAIDFWYTIIVYGWPLPMLAARWRRRRTTPDRWLRRAEPILAAGSCLAIYRLANVGTLAVGTYVALGANVGYMAGWLWEGRLSSPPQREPPPSLE